MPKPKTTGLASNAKNATTNNPKTGGLSGIFGAQNTTQSSLASQPTFNDPFSTPSRKQMLGQIADIYQRDPKAGLEFSQRFQRLCEDPNSIYYRRYGKATNQAVYKLNELGIDTNSLTDEWFANNSSWIESNLVRSAASNTPSTPGKKSTPEQITAYWLYQYYKSEEPTKQAEKEYQDAIREASYWAQRSDRNMSDEQIKQKVRKDFEKKYPTLAKMEKNDLSLLELNRGVDWSDDVLDGAIWAARNPDYQGGIDGAIAFSALGKGNVWKDDPQKAALLNPDDPAYCPYALGTTNLDDAARHFGVLYFGENWCERNKSILATGTDEDIKYFRQVQKAEQNYSDAKKALTALTDWMNRNLKDETDPATAKKKLDRILNLGKITVKTENGTETISLDILKKMDASVGKEGKIGTTDLIPMTQGVNYKYDNVIKAINDFCAANEAKRIGNGQKYIDYTNKSWYGRDTSAVGAAIKIGQNAQLKEDADIYEDYGTDSERAYVNSSWSADFDDVKTTVTDARDWAATDENAIKMISAEQKNVQKSYADSMITNVQVVYDYEMQEANLKALQEQIEKIRPEVLSNPDYAKAEGRDETITANGETYKVHYTYDEGIGYFVNSVKDSNGNDLPDSTPVNEQAAKDIERFNKEVGFGEKRDTAPQEQKDVTEDESYKQYMALKLSIEDVESYLTLNKEKYEQSKASVQEQQKNMAEQYYLLNQYGMDTYDLEVEELALAYVANFHDYDPTEWKSYNTSDMYRNAIANGEDPNEVYSYAEAINNLNLQEIENAKAVKQYFTDLGVKLPDDYTKNLDRHIAKLEREVKDYNYFLLTKEPDFKETAEKGRDIEYENRPKRHGLFNWYNERTNFTKEQYYDDIANYVYDEKEPYSDYGLRGLTVLQTSALSEDEKDIYYYLIGKGQNQEAMKYIGTLIDPSYGVLHTRFTENLKTKEEKAFGHTEDTKGNPTGSFVGENAKAVAYAPTAAIMSLAYTGYHLLSGTEYNPNNVMLMFNNVRNDVREESAKEIINIYGEGTTKQYLVQMGYEMLSNRLDSLANFAAYGGAGEAASAIAMGFTAAADAMSQAKRNNASDTQAHIVGAVTFLAETLTEKIEIGHVTSAFEKGFTKESVKKFFKDWLTKEGLSEMIGESLNDVFENVADELVMGDNSEYRQAVWNYRMQGHKKEEAEALARWDQIKGVFRTAVMSYLSPGMDIVAFTAGRGKYYTDKVAQYKSDNNVNISQAIKGLSEEAKADRKAKKEAAAAHEAWLNDDKANGEGAFNFGPSAVSPKGAEAEAKTNEFLKNRNEVRKGINGENALTDWKVLDSAREADTATQTAAIAAVLDDEGTDESSEVSNAIAANLQKVAGKRSALEWTQDVLFGASMEGINPAEVKQGIKYAALGGEESASYKVATSEEFQNATPDVQARMLAAAGYADAKSESTNSVADKSVFDNRVAEAEKLINLEQEEAMIDGLKGAVDDAATKLYEAEQWNQNRKDALRKAASAVTDASTEFLANPTPENKEQLNKAQQKLSSMDTMAKQAQLEYDNASQKLEKAQAALKEAQQEKLTKLRTEGVDRIMQIDAQRAAEKQKQAEAAEIEKARIAEEKKMADEIVKKAQATDNFTRLNAEDIVDTLFKGISKEDRQKAIGMTMKLQKEASNMDAFSVEARMDFAKNISKKFNLDTYIVDNKLFNARVNPKTGKLLVSRNATQSDIMYAILLHEITHLAEQSADYKALANMALGIKYGDGYTFDGILESMKKGDNTSTLAQDILAKKSLYDRVLTEEGEHSNEQMLQEIVADCVGYIISGDEKAINQIAQKPSLARKVINALRSFIRKARGLEVETITQAQKVADMLEKAVKKVEKKNGTAKHSLSTDYENALKSGDMKAAQEYVDAYAEDTGYDTNDPGYHGTPFFGFTKFDMGKNSNQIFVAYDKHIAETYSKNQNVREISSRSYDTMSGDYLANLATEIAMEAGDEQRITYNPKTDTYESVFIDENGNEEVEQLSRQEVIDGVEGYKEYIKERQAEEPFDFTRDSDVIENQASGIYKFYTRPGNQLIIDGNGCLWHSIPIEAVNEAVGRDLSEELLGRKELTTKTLGDWAMQNGYDSVRVNNIYDFGGAMWYEKGDRPAGDIGIFFNPTDVKSADPVTYDDQNKPISLEERFSSNEDFRYSLSDENAIYDDEGEQVATRLEGGTVALDTERFSLNSYTIEEQNRVRNALLQTKDDEGNLAFTEEEVDNYLDNLLNIGMAIAADKARLDFEATDYLSFLKDNDDYYFTLDASTLCAKRLLYQGTFDTVQHMMPDVAFMPEDLIDLVNIMKQMGYETPCGICYVESRRRMLDKFAQGWLDGYKGKYKPSIDELTTSDGLEALRENPKGSAKRKAYDDFIAAMNKKGSNNPKVVQLRTEYRGDIFTKMSENDIQKVKDIGGLRIQSFSDFEVPHLMDMMQAVYDMSARKLTAQAYTKVPNFAWGFGDTGIKINLSEIGKGIGYTIKGGLSFADLASMPYDEAMKLIDLDYDDVEGMNHEEAMKLRERYRKDVGTIIVGINDEHVIASMADPNIDYIIPFHKSGWSQEEIRKVGSLRNYADFTDYQNERVILGRETAQKVFEPKELKKDPNAVSEWMKNRRGEGKTKFTVQEIDGNTVVTAEGYKTQSFKIEGDLKREALKEKLGRSLNPGEAKKYGAEDRTNFTPVGSTPYWEFDKSGEYNARKYLQMCAEDGRMPKFWQFLVDNGDGSFSLPEGDDYRSTAIREGYWKTLTDFKMYENDSYGRRGGAVIGSPQRVVTPNINMPEAYRMLNEYKLGRQMPDKPNGEKGEFIPMESNNSLPVAMPAAELFKEHMEAKRARHDEEARVARENAKKGIKAPRISQENIALMESQKNLDQLNDLLKRNGYNGDLTLGTKGESGSLAWTIDRETGEAREGWKNSLPTDAEYRYSLTPVDPVQPSSDSWDRDTIDSFHDLQQTFPNIYNIQDDRTEDQKKNDTSVAVTLSTYRKIYKQLAEEGFEGTILDASSGLGLGTKAGREEFGFTVDDIEPFPDPGYKPSEGTDYSKLNKQYDVIISNAVLNVLSQDERDALVTKMGELLKEGGRMYINVRSPGDVANLKDNIDTEWIKANGNPSPENPYTGKKNIQLGENEYYTGRGTYQKGFTPQELASYVSDVLGPDYIVEIDKWHKTSGSNATGIVVTKHSSQRYSLPSEYEYLSAVDHGDMETAQRLVDERARAAGYIKAGYHGTLSGGFTVFDKAKAHIGGNSGAGFYFSSNLSDSEANYSDVEGADNWFKANDLADRILDEFRDSYEEDFEYEGYKITEGMPYNDVVEIAKKILAKNPQTYHVYLNPGKAYIRDFNNSTNLIEDVINSWNEEEKSYNFEDYDSEDDYFEDMYIRKSERISEAISEAVYNAFRDLNNNYELIGDDDVSKLIARLQETAVDYETLTWDDVRKAASNQDLLFYLEDPGIDVDGDAEITRAIIEAFGYDSIEDREVSRKFNQLKNMGNAGDTVHYIMFHPEQIKLADPVTYHPDGTVITPSERFGGTPEMKDDIRYSLPSDDALNDIIKDYLLRNKAPVSEAYTNPLEGKTPAMTTDKGPAVRGFTETIKSSDEIDSEVMAHIQKYNRYFPDTNADQIKRALAWIRSNRSESDPDGYNESFRQVTSQNFNPYSADGTVRLITMLGMAAARNDSVGQAILADLDDRAGTDMGRAFQARKLIRLMTPEGRKQSMTRLLEKVQGELNKKNINVDLKFSHWVYDMVAAANTEIEYLRAQQVAANEIAQQIPANWKDKLHAFRMLAMLGNPKTHIRNILGNMMFVPVVGIKNKLGALMELSKPAGQRTKTLSLRLDDAIRTFAKADAENLKGVLTGESKWNEMSMIDQNQKAFNGWLQKLVDANSNALEWEDWKFLKGHYTRALGGWMQANGYTAEQLRSNPVLLEQGRAYAVEEAQKATYRDFNELAKRLNNFVRNPKRLEGKVGALLVEAVLPFKKTPLNILRRGLEYSPLGLVKALTYDLNNLRQYNKAMNGELKTMPENAISPNQFIDKVSAGLTGVGIMAMGAFLSSLGLVTCGKIDDPDKEKGEQKYALKILGTDYTYTIDWAAPAVIPFFLGAAMYEEASDNEAMTWRDFANSLASISEPVFNLSMLDGISSVFKTSKFDDTNTLAQIGAKIGSNYITSYYPSAFGALTRTVTDNTRRRSYVPSDQANGPVGTFLYALQTLKNKIPFASNTSIPYRDIWGNPDEYSWAEGAAENFLSPGYIQKVADDPILNEMARLYDTKVEGSEKLMPGNPPKSKKYKNQQYYFTAEEYDAMWVARGQAAKSLLTDLMQNPDYIQADDRKKVLMMKSVWDYAEKVGLAAAIPDYDYDDLGLNAASTIAKEGKVTGYKADMFTALEQGDLDGYDAMVQALWDNDVEDSQIRQWIGNKYRDSYKSAYKRGRTDEMLRIAQILDNSGYAFDIYEWEAQVDEKR